MVLFLLSFFILLVPASPQTRQDAQPTMADTSLDPNTPVHLRLAEEVTSKKARVGERIALQVFDDVTVGDLVVIPRGTMAWGNIADAHPSKLAGRGGKLAVQFDTVATLTGEQVPLRGAEKKQGRFGMSATGGLGLLSVVLLPTLPLQRGEQVEIPKGTELTAFVKSRVTLDPARVAAENRALQERLKSPPVPRAPGKAVVSIYGLYAHEADRLHSGYLVRLDGKNLVHLSNNRFVSIQLEPGEHTFTSDHTELKLTVEKDTEYYVKVSDFLALFCTWSPNKCVKPDLQSISPQEGYEEMYPASMCTRHDIKDHSVAVVQTPATMPPLE
jgi:hypothetical protein